MKSKSLFPFFLLAILVCLAAGVALLAIESGEGPATSPEPAPSSAATGNSDEASFTRTATARRTARDHAGTNRTAGEPAADESLSIAGVVTARGLPVAGARVEAYAARVDAESLRSVAENLLGEQISEFPELAAELDASDAESSSPGPAPDGSEGDHAGGEHAGEQAGEPGGEPGGDDESATTTETHTTNIRVTGRNIRRLLRDGNLRRLIDLGRASELDEAGDGREPDAQAVTDGDGAFRVEGLAPGRYRLLVHAGGMVTGRVVVAAGADDVEVKLERGTMLRGLVTCQGAAVAGARVTAHGRTVTTSGAGAFEHDGIAPGETRLLVRADGYVSATRQIDTEETRGSRVEIELAPAGTVTGTVTDDSGAAVAGAVVAPDDDVFSGATSVRIDSASLREGFQTHARPPTATTGEDGRYTLTGMPAGSAELVVTAEGFLDGRLDDLSVRAGDTTTGADTVLVREARLEGTITDASGQAVAGADVSVAIPDDSTDGVSGMVSIVFGGNETSGRSGENGAYGVGQIPAGEHEVTISGDGYLSQKRTVTFRAGRTETLDVALDTGFTVAGVVLRPDGQPLDGADVNVQWPSQDDDDNPMSGMIASMFGGEGTDVTTGADGRFEATGLQPGPYVVKAEHDEYLAATVRDVEAGWTDVEFTLGAAGAVTGRVISEETGEPVERARIQRKGGSQKGGIFAAVMQGMEMTFSASDGTFRVTGLEPGRYQFWASREGHAASERTAVDVIVGETTAGVELTLRRPVTLSGRVVDAATGRPIVGARVEVPDQNSPFGGMGMRISVRVGSGGDAVVTDASGRFTVEGLTPGSVELVVESDDHAGTTVRGIRVPGDDVTVELSGGGTVTGVVTGPDGRPERGASVALQSMTAGSLDAETEADGRYVFEHVTPGVYRAMLVREGANPFENMRMKSVTVREGETTRLDFGDSAGAGATVSGVVLEDGKPLDGATVILNRSGAGTRMKESDERGRFAFEGVEPGRYQIIAQRGLMGGGSVNAEVVVAASGVEGGQIRLELSSLSVSGTVVDAESGAPVEMALLRVVIAQGGAGSVEEALAAQRGQGFSGPDGTFEIKGVPQGTFRLYVTATGYASKYVDGVRAGGDALTVAMSTGVQLEVQVVGPDGAPVSGAVVHADDPEGRERAGLDLNLQGLSDADGLARLQLDPGTYFLRIQAAGFATAKATASTTAGTVTVRLERGGSLSLEVVDAAGVAVPGATVTLTDADGEPVTDRLSLRSSISGLSRSTGADGRFVRDSLPAGRISVVVRTTAGAEARRSVSITAGETTSVRIELP